MLKKWLHTFTILFVSMSLYGQNITKIKVISIPLYTTSTFRITCNEFDKNFPEMKKEVILNKNKVREIEVVLSSFKAINSKGIDVRGKLVICYNKKRNKVICFNLFGHFFFDGGFFENKKLFNFLLLNKFIAY